MEVKIASTGLQSVMSRKERKIGISSIAIVMLFFLGLSIASYPFISNWFYQSGANETINKYSSKVDSGDIEEFEKAIAEAQEYNKVLVGQTVPDVFAIREGTTNEQYESMLNIMGDLMMGFIEIPIIDVHLPIYHYSTEDSLSKGCGHIFGSSLPVGGISTHAVITAHRGLPNAELFTDLDKVREGDRFYLRMLNLTLAYEVDKIEVVEPADTRSLAIEQGKDYVTLVTCTPYGINSDRLLVRGHRVDYKDGDDIETVDSGIRVEKLLSLLNKITIVVLAVGLAALFMWYIGRRIKKATGREDSMK